MRCWNFYLLSYRQVNISDMIFVQVCKVQKSTQRHVGAVGGLVLIKAHIAVNDKGNIIFHFYKNSIFKGGDRELDQHSQFHLVHCTAPGDVLFP